MGPKRAADELGAESLAVEEPDLVEAVRRARTGERVLVRGDDARPAVAIVSLSDLRRLEEDDRRRREGIAVLEGYSRLFSHLDQDEIEREAVEAVREVRAEMWAERQRRGGE